MNQSQRETIARHEAGHVVMRWLRGLPATAVRAGDEDGLSEGTGERISPDTDVLVTLAGIVVESNYDLSGVDFSRSQFDDLDRARKALSNPLLQMLLEALEGPELDKERGSSIRWMDPVEPDEALTLWFDKACKMLRPHGDVVECIAEALLDRGSLAAAEVSEILGSFENPSPGDATD